MVNTRECVCVTLKNLINPQKLRRLLSVRENEIIIKRQAITIDTAITLQSLAGIRCSRRTYFSPMEYFLLKCECFCGSYPWRLERTVEIAIEQWMVCHIPPVRERLENEKIIRHSKRPVLHFRTGLALLKVKNSKWSRLLTAAVQRADLFSAAFVMDIILRFWVSLSPIVFQRTVPHWWDTYPSWLVVRSAMMVCN